MLWTAFTIGLFGSLHCVGMCGPIALALPQSSQNHLQRLWGVLLYNSGRIITYTLLGLLIGTLGLGARLAGIQAWLSIAMGLILLVLAIWQFPLEQSLSKWPALGRFQIWIRGQFGRYWSAKAHHLFRLGMLNGLLPCGLVYIAIVGALSMDSLGKAAIYMSLFGLGTLPLMLATIYIGQSSGIALRRRLWRYYPVFLGAVSIWLIIRGVQFSLPNDVSMWSLLTEMPMCH